MTGHLHLFCGKMGAGKSTLAKEISANEISANENGIILREDDWLAALYPDQIKTPKDYKKYSDLLKPVIFELVVALLKNDQPVIMDFPANTKAQRQWLKGIIDEAQACHTLYYLDVPDDICIKQIKSRAKHETDTEEMFMAMLGYFDAPCDDEGLTIKTMKRV